MSITKTLQETTPKAKALCSTIRDYFEGFKTQNVSTNFNK